MQQPDRSLTVVPEEMTARSIVSRGADQANALMEVVTKAQGVAVNIGGRRYLKYEAWATIARFNKASARTDWTKPVEEDGKLIAYEARVSVVAWETNETIASAEAMCGIDEFVTQGQRDPIAKRNAARSMAQTRAASKAFRMAFSWVAVLAGFEGTPAEEMGPDDRQERPSNSQRQRQTIPGQSRPAAPEDDTTRFFREVKEMGYTNEQALKMLDAKTITEWTARTGKTVADALAELRQYKA